MDFNPSQALRLSKTMIETMELITCVRCSKQFKTPSFYSDSQTVFKRTLCDPCDEMNMIKRNREENAMLIPERMNEFKRFCPPAYFESDMDRLPHGPLAKVVNYKFNSRGLFCVGDSGRGKTRSCWLLIKQLWANGIKVMCLTESGFAEKIDRFSESRDTDSYLESLKKAPLLFIDDLGHAALDKKYLQRFLQVIEGRTNSNRPIIATSQFSGNELIGKLQGSEKTLGAIVRRLRDFCDVVNFNED